MKDRRGQRPGGGQQFSRGGQGRGDGNFGPPPGMPPGARGIPGEMPRGMMDDQRGPRGPRGPRPQGQWRGAPGNGMNRGPDGPPMGPRMDRRPMGPPRDQWRRGPGPREGMSPDFAPRRFQQMRGQLRQQRMRQLMRDQSPGDFRGQWQGQMFDGARRPNPPGQGRMDDQAGPQLQPDNGPPMPPQNAPPSRPRDNPI